MASFFSATRSRQIIYTPEVKSTDLHPKVDMGKYAKASEAANKFVRLVSDNVPSVDVYKRLKANKYLMPGVQRVSWTYARDVTEQYGLQRYTLLPWYTKAVVIQVSGKYYMGAFAQDTIVSAATLVAGMNHELTSWIRKEMSNLDRKIVNLGVIGKTYKTAADQGILSSLAVGPLNDPDSMSLLGFIRRFKIEESVDSPFVQNYEMEYIGIDREWYIDSRSSYMYSSDGPVK